MKKIIFIIVAALILTACNNGTENEGIDISVIENIGADQDISDTLKDSSAFCTDLNIETIPDSLQEKDDNPTESEQERGDVPKESMNDILSTESSENTGTENEVTFEGNAGVSEGNAGISNDENKSNTESHDKPPYALNGQITMFLTEMTEQSPEQENDIFAPQFIIVNSTEYDYWYGLGFTLERLTDEESWETVEQIEPVAVISIAVMVASGESNIFDAPITPAYGELEAGKYRVVLNVSCDMGTETLYGEFDIK